jgi:hypothetical protein
MTIAWGEVYGADPGHWRHPPTRSTATSALGHLLTKGTMYASVHNAVPSNTSRYTATDYGIVHVIGLDLMNFDQKQIDWLDADLTAANANRDKVPWIMASAHFPLYHATVSANAHKSAAHFLGEEGEAEIVGQPLPPFREPQTSDPVFSTGRSTWRSPVTDGHAFVECAPGAECTTVGEWQAQVSAKLEPLLLKHGVDVFNAGHSTTARVELGPTQHTSIGGLTVRPSRWQSTTTVPPSRWRMARRRTTTTTRRRRPCTSPRATAAFLGPAAPSS